MLYFDNAATTKISKKSLEAYNQASDNFYNPSALYAQAGVVKGLVENARSNMLKFLKGKAGATILYTGCATESNNAVLNSCVTRKDKKYLISAGEHSSVYETAKKLQAQGYSIQFISLKKDGTINEEELFSNIDDTVSFVSLIHVSNETGAINNLKDIISKIRTINKNIVVHSDGVQAIGKLNINLSELDVDYYTFSAHKINGPKGVGALYIKSPNKFKPFISGGGQEFGLRSGTENIPGIVAFEQALLDTRIKDYFKHKQAIISQLKEDYVLVSGDNCVDNIISLCFANVRGETIVHVLENKGYLIGTGSACNSKAKLNRVLQPIVDRKYIEGAVRISFGDDITIADCEALGKELNNAVADYKRKVR